MPRVSVFMNIMGVNYMNFKVVHFLTSILSTQSQIAPHFFYFSKSGTFRLPRQVNYSLPFIYAKPLFLKMPLLPLEAERQLKRLVYYLTNGGESDY